MALKTKTDPVPNPYADQPSTPKQESRIDALVRTTGLTRDELIDRLLVGAFSEGPYPTASELLSGS